MKISSKNIKSFIEGHYNWFLDKLGSYPKHRQEQVLYRLSLCKDCIEEGGCKYCGCPPEKKVYASSSCNNDERFPRMMNYDAWEKYKIENKITINNDDI